MVCKPILVFSLSLSQAEQQHLEIVEETRLLGLIISTDLGREANTMSICSKALTNMWLLRRMKYLKLENEVIINYYIKQVRPLTEQGVPIWNSGLNKLMISKKYKRLL